MAKAATAQKKASEIRRGSEANVGKGTSLTGTFVCVMLLGGFLALSWLSVFMLFIHRN